MISGSGSKLTIRSSDDERDPRTLDAGGVAAFLRERGFAPDTVASVRCVGLSGAQLLALSADDLADEELGLEPDEAAKLARLIREETSNEPGGGPAARSPRAGAWRVGLLVGAAATAAIAVCLAVLARRRRRR